MQNFNLHQHTYRCGHADNNYSDLDYVLESIANNLDVICFTDHAPNSVDKRKNMRMKYSEKDEYFDSIDRLKNEYKDRITIYKGLEVEYTGDNEEELLDFKKDSDLLILGQHFIVKDGNVKISNIEKYTDEDLDIYVSTIEKALSLGVISILAHPDFVMFSRDSFGEKEEEMAHKICRACEKYKIPIEINLNRIFFKTYFDRKIEKMKPYKDPSYYIDKLKNIEYPSRRFWEIVSLYDVKVLYGIDVHFKGQISLFKELTYLANSIIGEETINKLKFCTYDEIINKKK